MGEGERESKGLHDQLLIIPAPEGRGVDDAHPHAMHACSPRRTYACSPMRTCKRAHPMVSVDDDVGVAQILEVVGPPVN